MSRYESFRRAGFQKAKMTRVSLLSFVHFYYFVFSYIILVLNCGFRRGDFSYIILNLYKKIKWLHRATTLSKVAPPYTP